MTIKPQLQKHQPKPSNHVLSPSKPKHSLIGYSASEILNEKAGALMLLPFLWRVQRYPQYNPAGVDGKMRLNPRNHHLQKEQWNITQHNF